jgi:hypothetical protein
MKIAEIPLADSLARAACPEPKLTSVPNDRVRFDFFFPFAAASSYLDCVCTRE